MAGPLLAIDALHPHPRVMQRALEALRAGKLIAYPTDTRYALGCDSEARRSIEALATLRLRPGRRSLTLLCSGLSELSQYAQLSNYAHRFVRSRVPGPFTFVLPSTKRVPAGVQKHAGEVGIRVPESPVVQSLVGQLERPLVSATATDEEGEPLIDPKDIKARYGDSLELILDAGVLGAEGSTVVSLLKDEAPEVLREGKGQL